MTPTEAGFYWASTGDHEWYNVIVAIEGKAPLLRIAQSWGYVSFDLLSFDLRSQKLDPEDIQHWGPKCERPDMSPEQVAIVKGKPC